jgi:hypothetical protein
MRLATIALAAFALLGCATAVNDSLDRRGVDRRSVLADRVTAARDDAAQAKTAFDKARSALDAIAGLDGAPLARQLDQARAAGQDAALATQDLRLTIDTAKTAGERYFKNQNEEMALMKPESAAYAAAAADLAAVETAHRAFAASFDAAKLRLSPALSLYDTEITTLRANPTSRNAVDARQKERAATRTAVTDASDSLAAAVAEADRYLETLK